MLLNEAIVNTLSSVRCHIRLVGGAGQWLGRRSFADGLSLICA